MDGNISSQLLERHYPNPAQEVAMWTVAILIVLLNILVFLVAPRMKMIQPCTWYGMMSLAVADFGMGLTDVVTLSYNYYSGYQLHVGHLWCSLSSFLVTLFGSVSILTLMFMKVDRLLTLAFPLRFSQSFSPCQVISVHIAIWLFMVCYLAPSITGTLGTAITYNKNGFICFPDLRVGQTYYWILLTMSNVIPTFVIGVCFGGIFYIARKRVHSSFMQIHRGDGENINEDSQWKRDLRIIKTLVIMTSVPFFIGDFYIAFFPFFVTIAGPEMITGKSLHPVTDFLMTWLASSNSFWNPIVYLACLKPFYTAMVQVYGDMMSACYGKSKRKEKIVGPSGGTRKTGITQPVQEVIHCTRL